MGDDGSISKMDRDQGVINQGNAIQYLKSLRCLASVGVIKLVVNIRVGNE